MKRLPTLFAPVLAAGCASTSHPPPLPPAEPGTPKTYACPITPRPIQIDGVIDEREWAGAAWSEAFVDIEGAMRAAPRFRTRMRMLWDSECLYVAAEMEEPHLTGWLKRRDEIVFHDNDFEIFIDPNGDTRNYFEIEVNALGTIFDLFLTRTYIEGGPVDHDWNMPGMRWAVKVHGTLNDPHDLDRGWSVEFALPWSGFGGEAGMACPSRAGDQWRINFSRVQWHYDVIEGGYRKAPGTKEDNWVWTPQGVIDMHRPQRWGFVQFIGETAPDGEQPN